jgi:hypothetical protein
LQKLYDSNLDGGTTQWVSASIMNGNTERIKIPKFKEEKINLSYDAPPHWKNQREKGKCWEPRYDHTIEKQAKAFVNYLKTGKMDFRASHSEDYCFARAFGCIDKETGEKIFPQLRKHESNRLQEMEEALEDALKYKKVFSKDHRVIQAVIMKSFYSKNKVKVLNPNSVNKSWPQFWDFMNYVRMISHSEHPKNL